MATWIATWQPRHRPVDAHTATLLPNGKVLVAGGLIAAQFTASAELYDPATGTWSATGSLNTARAITRRRCCPTARCWWQGDLVAVASFLAARNCTTRPPGRGVPPAASPPHALITRRPCCPTARCWWPGDSTSGVQLSSAELYDPASGTWSATGSLTTARAFHTATLLPNGKVLVAGGEVPARSLSSAELYDPASGTWSATGSLSTAREFHTATLLPNGKVLVAGGQNNNVALSSAELYDPALGTWSATGSLSTARRFHTATLLPNGEVLVAGGLNSSASASASVELYDPASGSWSATGSLNNARVLSHGDAAAQRPGVGGRGTGHRQRCS